MQVQSREWHGSPCMGRGTNTGGSVEAGGACRGGSRMMDARNGREGGMLNKRIMAERAASACMIAPSGLINASIAREREAIRFDRRRCKKEGKKGRKGKQIKGSSSCS